MEEGDGRSPNESSLIDIGTGAGFPGLPLKILYPSLQLTLVESIAKKTRFLEAVVSELGLTNVYYFNRAGRNSGARFSVSRPIRLGRRPRRC